MPNAAPPDIATELKRVLRHLPAPVSIVTSINPETGAPVGLAMSAIMPVCLEPSSMAIAVNRSGSAHADLLRSGRFCINLLNTSHHLHMAPFAGTAPRQDRFTQSDWRNHDGLWYIDGAPANIFCALRDHMSYGTHDLIIGEVEYLLHNGEEEILGWANGALGRLSPIAS